MIGICIKYSHENYGGMLQSFSTVKMLEKRGLNYELIQYKKHYSFVDKLKNLPRLLNRILLNDKKEAILKKIGKIWNPCFKKNDAIRLDAFKRFASINFTKLSPLFVGFDKLREGAKRYTAIVTGSDQLWSPSGLPTNFFNLMFVANDIRKISIASSFGVKQIPWYQTARTRYFLNRINFISMRENRGKEIVKELTGRDVSVILDPVFFFNEKEWAEIVPIEKEIDEPYIFAYFLGQNLAHRVAVKSVAKKLQCKIVALRHLDQFIASDEQFGDFAPYDVDPSRFLNLLRGANYVCTDSFHGSVFSIIHHKPFVIFNRYPEHCKISKNSRIESLCENLGIADRRFTTANNLFAQLSADICYEEVDNRLTNLKNMTNAYLDSAFDGVK